MTFGDMALYTMVKTNTFNGMPLPSIVWRDKDGSLTLVKQFGYEDSRTACPEGGNPNGAA